MDHVKRHTEPIAPGTRVAVFLDEGASGGTLGHYGTLLGVCASTMASSGNRDRKYYRIHVPALGRVIALESTHFLIIRDTNGESQLLSPAEIAHLDEVIEPCELEFESPVSDDNNELYGHYRFGLWQRGWFHFRKHEHPQPSYQLGMPIAGKHEGRAMLRYRIPANEILDRGYVLRTLASVLGCSIPVEANEAR